MVKIRKATDNDIPQLEKLFLEVRQSTFTWESPDRYKLEDYEKSVEKETVFLAEDQAGLLLGFISVWEYDSPAFIHNLFVKKSHQRKGIGLRLIHGLSPWIPPPYRLKCIVKNKNALSFYLKNHWSIIDKGVCPEDGAFLLLELTK